jgi:hypothetical protein
MIVFDESTTFWQIWFVGAKGVDWLAALYKPKDGSWICKYRFRYHEDEKAHDSADRKSWTMIESSDAGEAPPTVFIETISTIAKLTAKHYSGEIHALPVRGNGLKAAEALSRESWSHLKVVPASEAL